MFVPLMCVNTDIAFGKGNDGGFKAVLILLMILSFGDGVDMVFMRRVDLLFVFLLLIDYFWSRSMPYRACKCF